MRSGPFSSTRMVSLPPALPDSPSAVRNIRAAIPAVFPLPFGHVGGGEMVAVAPQSFPADRDRRPARVQACWVAASRDLRMARRRVFANRSAALRYPRRRRRDRPWTGSVSSTGASPPGRSVQRCSSTSTAERRSATCAPKPRIASWYWSATARVIAPAHRDEDTAVSARLRWARHCACSLPSNAAQPNPRRGLTAIHRPEQVADRGQRRGLRRRGMDPGPDPQPRPRRGHHRVSDPTQRPPPSHAPHPGSHHRHQRRCHHRSLQRSIKRFRSLSGQQLPTCRSQLPHHSTLWR